MRLKDLKKNDCFWYNGDRFRLEKFFGNIAVCFRYADSAKIVLLTGITVQLCNN